MDIRCPKCDFSRHIPDEAISSDMTIATCPKCSERFRFRTAQSAHTMEGQENETGTSTAPANDAEPETTVQHSTHQEKTAETIPSYPGESDSYIDDDANAEEPPAESSEEEAQYALPPDTPWGMINEMGFFPALYMTIKVVMFSPHTLFTVMRRDTPFTGPLTFYLLTAMMGVLFELIWHRAFGNVFFTQVGDATLTMADVFITLIFSPILLSLYLFFIGGLIHLGLLITGVREGKFVTTLRVLCYSSALDVLGAIPILGSFIGLFWKIYVIVVGLRVAHNITLPQALTAIALPMLLYGFIVFSMLQKMGILA